MKEKKGNERGQTGSDYRLHLGKMLFFSIPLMLTNLLQVLFNMADIAVIGQFAGSLSLGAVGSTTTLVTLFTGVLIGMAGGINVLVARYFGARVKEAPYRLYILLFL